MPKDQQRGWALNDNEAAARFDAGVEHATRWYDERSADDRSAAVAHLRAARGLIGDDHPARGDLAALLGPLLAQELATTTPGADAISEALAEFRHANTAEPELALFVRHFRALVHVLRYVMLDGAESDREFALAEFTALLDDPWYTAEFGDLARLAIIQLSMSSVLPAGSRGSTDPADPDMTERLSRHFRHQASGTVEGVLHEVSGHLMALSDETSSDPTLATVLSILRAAATTPFGTSPEQAEQVERAIAHAEHGLRHQPDDTERALLSTLRTALFAQRARIRGTPQDADAAIEAAAQTRPLLDDTMPFAQLLRDITNVSTTPLSGSRPLAEGDAVTAVDGLRRLLDRLPLEGTSRTTTLVDFANRLGARLAASGSTTGIEELRTLIKSATDNPAADDANVAVLHQLHGMLNAFEGVMDDDTSRISAALTDIRTTARMLPDDHPLRELVDPLIGSILSQRSITSASLVDMEAATNFLRHTKETASVGPRERTLADGMNALSETMTKLARFQRGHEPALLDEIIDAFGDLTPEVQQASQLDVGAVVSQLKALRQSLRRMADPRLAFTAARKSRSEVGPAPPPATDDFWGRRNDALMTGMMLVNDGFAGWDLDMLDRGVTMLGRAVGDIPLNSRERVKLVGTIGIALMFRYMRSRRSTDLGNAIAQLEQAALLARQEPGMADVATLFYCLGDAYHRRGDSVRRDHARAADNGLVALRERAGEVLLQSGAQHALTAAEAATGEAADITRWCLAAGRGDLAVQALEIGRALVLHSVSVEATVPDVLGEAGQHQLAEQWKHESAAERGGRPELSLGALRVDGPTVPSDLRHRVLTQIAGTKAESLLLAPPTIEVITAALRRTRTQAMVYLLPRQETQPGLALIVRDDGVVTPVPLDKLDIGSTKEFEEARRGIITPTVDNERRWQQAMNDLCDWSWRVAMGTVLELLPGLARIVLVPVGRLGVVPWHAARRPVGRGVRYACQDSVITYAASARQFVDAAGRPNQPWDASAAVVRIEDEKLRWTRHEVETIREHCYPGSAYLDDGVRPADVLAHLPSDTSPGASVLHLSCHARYQAPAVDSHLLLHDAEPLPVRDILRQARHRPADAPGGLVVLAACASDLTEGAHDEALTLTTAFLAAGAAGAVGARWPIVDLPTTFFMIMFHHYLTHGYEDPAIALRAAQLWMLNPDRRLPSGISRTLERSMRRAHLDDVGNWAAFTYQGR